MRWLASLIVPKVTIIKNIKCMLSTNGSIQEKQIMTKRKSAVKRVPLVTDEVGNTCIFVGFR